MFSFDALAALPYGAGKPSVSCVFKRDHDDFVVDECLGYELPIAEQNEHLWLLIEKRGQNTAWVAQKLASHFGRPDLDVSYAGLKDRQAVTRQWFSVRLANVEKLASFSLNGVEVQQHAFCNKKLKRGELAGNQFEICLREVSDMPALLASIDTINQQGVPNYFAAQRFGHNAGNILLAERWCRNQHRPRGRVERGLLLSAMRSWLFNLQVAQGFAQAEEFGYLAGKSRDPEAELLQQACLGYEQQRAWLAKQGCSLHRRPLRIRPQVMVEVDGDIAVLTMNLPAGSYATAVLRELVTYA